MKAKGYCNGCGIAFSHHESKCPQCRCEVTHWRCVCGFVLTKSDSRCHQNHPMDSSEAPQESFNPWKS